MSPNLPIFKLQLFYGWHRFCVSYFNSHFKTCHRWHRDTGDTGAVQLPGGLILNLGAEICSLLQTGQRLGVLRRVRFLKEKPHCWQKAGSSVRRLGWTDLSICMRWSRASLSLIPNNCEISRKSRDSPSKASAIFFLKVDISIFKLSSEFCQDSLMEYPKWSNDSGIRVYNLQSEIRILQLVRPTFLWRPPNRNIPSLTPQPWPALLFHQNP